VLRYTNGGQAVTTLGLAINSRRFNRTSQQCDAEPTTFLDGGWQRFLHFGAISPRSSG